MLTSHHANNGLEVSITYVGNKLVATVITDHYRRKDVLTDKEVDYITNAAQSLWYNRKQGASPFANFARVYHGMIL